MTARLPNEVAFGQQLEDLANRLDTLPAPSDVEERDVEEMPEREGL